jgi:acyl-CoA synthetase (NDP forming)
VGVLCADTAESLGLPLTELAPPTVASLAEIMPSFATAQNPVDMTASLMTQGGMFADTLKVLASDPHSDMFLIGVPVAGPGYDVPGMAADVAHLASSRQKAVAVSAPQNSVRSTFRQAGVPVFNHETDAVHALHQWSRHGALITQAAARDALEKAKTVMPCITPQSEALLNEAESLDLLSAASIPTVPRILCRSLDEALTAWRKLGPVVVLKACSAHIPHKSEHGLVFLNVDSEEQLEHAWMTCIERVKALNISFEGAIVAAQVIGRREFALGVKQDPSFGTVVMVSDGGKYVEALRDFVVLLYPFSEDDVLTSLRGLRIAPILAGVR